MKKYLAIDLGASSGRGIIGTIENGRIDLREIHRFSNDPVFLNNGFFWDTIRLVYEIKQAINKAALDGGVDAIGIDTWGVDYGYIDKKGVLLSPPYHYRDTRTTEAMKDVYSKLSYEELYNVTGIEEMSFNTVYQIADDIKNRPWVVENADKLLLTPDLLGYFLTGKAASEYTIASTTAMLDAKAQSFSKELLATLSVPERLFAPIVHPGNILGQLTEQTMEETGAKGAQVVNVGSHDTASAILSVPAVNDDFLFISSGTWSLMGIESDVPVINDVTRKYCFTNEGGVFGKINIMKNIMGLWLVQESRRQWRREGKEYSFDEMSSAALASEPFRSIINPDDPMFGTSGDLPGRIAEYCKKTGQPVPENVGQVIRCIFESLALRYRWTAEKLEELTGKKYSTINIVGGGTKDELLCSFTANGTGRKVIAGPVEATAIGNILMQAYAMGEIRDINEARSIVKNTFDIKRYEPDLSNAEGWEKAYQRFCRLI